MSIIRVTMIMGVGRFAWSESHWTNKFETVQAAIPEVTGRLMDRRARLFGKETAFIGVRINTQGTLRDSKLLRPDDAPRSPFLDSAHADEDGDTDVEDVAIICRGYSGTNRARNFFLRGCPDVAEGNAFQPKKLDPQNANFLKELNFYFGYLTANSWGFWGRVVGLVPKPATAFIADAAPPTKYGVKLSAAITAPAVGDKIQLRGFKVRPGANKINGQYQVADPAAAFAADPPVYYLQNSLGIDPSSVVKWGTAEPTTMGYLPYSDGGITVSYVKRRATGGRSVLPLGRRKIRK